MSGKRKLPVRLKRVELKGDYQGWWFDTRLNVPFEKFLDKLDILAKTDPKDFRQTLSAMYDVLEIMVVAWNFVDEKGNDVPPTKDNYARLPLDLLSEVCQLGQEAIITVPLAPSES